MSFSIAVNLPFFFPNRIQSSCETDISQTSCTPSVSASSPDHLNVVENDALRAMARPSTTEDEVSVGSNRTEVMSLVSVAGPQRCRWGTYSSLRDIDRDLQCPPWPSI